MKGRAFDYDQSVETMSGLMTSSIAEPMMERHSARSTTRPCPPLVRGQWSSDQYSRECLAIRVDRKLNSGNVIDVLSDLFILHGVPSFIRSDNGPEFVAHAVQDWIKAVGAKTAYIEPGSPWENGYCESFNARFRDEFLNN